MSIKTDYIPSGELAALAYMRQSAAVVSASPTTYGVSTTVINALNTALDAFDGGLQSAHTQYELSKSTTVAKDAAKETAIAQMRAMVRQIQANPNVTDTQKAEAGLPVHSSSRAPVPCYTPTALVATADILGNVNLKWNTGANRSHTIYQIQSAPTATGPWTVVATTERKTFQLTNQPVAETQWFRIIATRPRSSAAPSTPVSIWNMESSTELKLAA